MATETTLSEKTLEDIEKAAQILSAGGLVAVPTETVYGLAADADNPTAVRSTFTAKGRPADHPLIVHVTGFEALSAWVSEIPEYTKTLTDAFWPGPLTLVFKKSDRVNDAVTGGQDTVAIRCPSHPVMRALLKRFAGNVKVVTVAAPGLMECVERGDFNSETTRELLLKYLTPIKAAGADKLVLGCTHYPFLSEAISEIMGPEAELLEPGKPVALVTRARLRSLGLLNDEDSASCAYFVAGAKEHQATLKLLLPGSETIAELPV